MEIIDLNAENVRLFLSQIAEIHKDSYPRDLLTANFNLRKLYEYYSYLISFSKISFVIVDEEKREVANAPVVAGFVVAGPEVSKGIQMFLSYNRLYVLLVLLRKPSLLIEKILQILFELAKKVFEKDFSVTKFRLLSICVRKSYQSRGVGKTMLKHLEDILARNGCKEYGLSVKANNKSAIAFYEKNGFVLEKTYIGSRYYVKHLEHYS